MPLRRITALALLPLIFNGCAVGPDYKTPEIKTPQAWRIETPSNANSVANLPWWEIFKDAELQVLIQEGLSANKDLKIALTRLVQARESAEIAEGAYLPTVGYTAGAYRSRPKSFSANGMHGFSLGGSIQWEVDLWGRLRRLNESAAAQYFASVENKNATVLALVAEIANGYFRLRMLDAQLATSRQTAETREKAYKLSKSKLDNGVGNRIDTSYFESDMLSAQASIFEFERGIAVQENALNLLLGRLPGPIARSNTIPSPILQEIPAGLPSELLLRRPDVRAAEHQVRAANAKIGAAIAEFFPKVSLTAALGFFNPQLGHLLEHDSLGRQGGGGLLGPIFAGGTIYHGVKQAEAFTKETVLGYEQTALNAFREVNDALVTIRSTRERIQKLEKQVAVLREALENTRKAYESGVLPFLPVLDADRNLFSAQLLLNDVRTAELESAVQLYKALGGGWRAGNLSQLVNEKGEITGGPGAKAKEKSEEKK
ncbi:MAG: efflux transporter outer membrane subunit [Puniceicoccales bacterium]|jgi:multidrug efflux system outer membrane protein|nr:efflux transporter outer membrane subunit [Puniceicoccales bacterium]